ncbi:MAG: recombination protein RecR [Bacteroidales bacterium]|nr:recombination protein RecR [Bacteroidales bacterium]
MEALPSKLLERTVEEFSKLPGVGKQTALRFALHLLRQNKSDVALFTSTIDQMMADIKLCKHCHCISDSDVCEICSNPKRQNDVVCVVENIQGLMAIENTAQFSGVYHVLGGVISPIDGIGINDLTITQLLERVEKEGVKEVILALPTTMEGDTTNFYIHRQLQRFPVQVSTIARGVAIGDNLEYADEITLGRSIVNRVPFDSVYKNN